VDYSSLPDVELLRRIVGPRVAERICKGALTPLFSPDAKPRMLAEEMRRDNVLTSPTAVRDDLWLLFRGREYARFAVLYLDMRSSVLPSTGFVKGRTRRSTGPAPIFSELHSQEHAVRSSCGCRAPCVFGPRFSTTLSR
jgi:hypothetical protein